MRNQISNDSANSGSASDFNGLSRREFLKIGAAAAAGWLMTACQGSTPAPATVDTPTPLGSSPIPIDEYPMGIGRGIFPGRVSWAHNRSATRWDGSTGYWWQPEYTDRSAVAEMLSQSLHIQTGQATDTDAWEALFTHFNQARGRGETGFLNSEKVAIKVNLNACDKHAYLDNGSFTSPHLLVELLLQLVHAAGVPAQAITVYDAIRSMPDCIIETCQLPDLDGVSFVDWSGGPGQQASQRDISATVKWSQDVGGNPAYLPTCVTEADYLINLATLKGHTLAGVTLCAKNHFGTILSDLEGKPTNYAPQGANLHGYIAAKDFDIGPGWAWPQRPMGTYNALVDLMGHDQLGGKTLLFILDGLYGAPNQSTPISAAHRWTSPPFDGHWPSSLFISQDGAAIDSVGLDFLQAEPMILAQPDVLPPGSTPDNYLHEAALADQPPSGVLYDPNQTGGLPSLGAHEHWQDAQTREYSRNLGLPEGIELVKV